MHGGGVLQLAGDRVDEGVAALDDEAAAEIELPFGGREDGRKPSQSLASTVRTKRALSSTISL
jgi:hypothetical protein